MSDFWSAWVIVFVVLTFGIAIVLFVWAPRVDIPTQPDGTTGHVWAHGVLRESVRRLPLWYLLPSAAVIVIVIGYLVLYPGFGAARGALGWTAHGELAQTQAANEEREKSVQERVRGKPVEVIATDPAVLRKGEVIFIDNCAACHGRQARGNIALGAPDLTDHVWQYGGDGPSILASIGQGRHGMMPAFGATLDEAQVKDLAHYVLSLSGRAHDMSRAQFGKPHFAVCAACHGAEGKGNPALGAPNLAAGAFLYGGSLADIEATIRGGRNGMMPAWEKRLSGDDIASVAAWVFAQSRPARP